MQTTLYFAYAALLSPRRILEVVPEAQFRFIAHLPETRLVFPHQNGLWDGGLPSVKPEPGNTVWGAVFEIPVEALAGLDETERSEGRERSEAFKAVDREGHRHPVVTHVHKGAPNGEYTPCRDYMRLVVDGGRHWKLPTGWVAGLEEYVEEPSF
ncbi:hypothetical protein BMS3Abin02_01000 [bacterium BMS3Abin02]|nr:hypothetical protein BMS3Abin02_01000 [bacterium BMS3Abin02]HDH26378.1 gamma-glutamylcyclotransferase [Actinomycetota bacterium]HDK45777.1 gamma-glutamylcyclotransferase [Actinomycetota bacterium]HDL48963.1 gamma-glutamylcyclotransferase [Actinomycetota bacterium]